MSTRTWVAPSSVPRHDGNNGADQQQRALKPISITYLSLSLLPSLCKNRDFPLLFFFFRIDELAPYDVGKC